MKAMKSVPKPLEDKDMTKEQRAEAAKIQQKKDWIKLAKQLVSKLQAYISELEQKQARFKSLQIPKYIVSEVQKTHSTTLKLKDALNAKIGLGATAKLDVYGFQPYENLTTSAQSVIDSKSEDG